MKTPLDYPDPASIYDAALRFTVPSRSKGGETHMVDLDCYEMNGRCDCMHFVARLEPLLSRMVKPEEAIARGLVKLRKDQRHEDALRCHHITEAYREFACVAARAISSAKTKTSHTAF